MSVQDDPLFVQAAKFPLFLFFELGLLLDQKKSHSRPCPERSRKDYRRTIPVRSNPCPEYMIGSFQLLGPVYIGIVLMPAGPARQD
jgi:hypothetical protein